MKTIVFNTSAFQLKTLDTILSKTKLGVFQNNYTQNKKTCVNLNSIGRRICRIIIEGKNTLVTRNCVLSDA